MKNSNYITKKERATELKTLAPKVKKFLAIQRVYRGFDNVPTAKTWIQICDEYEVLLKSYIRADYLNQCCHTN